MAGTLLHGASVVSMAPGRPDSEEIDILIEGDRIADTAAHLDVGDAEVVDLTGRIVIPGLINAHQHTWQTALRSFGADWTLLQYLACTRGPIARRYLPQDIYVGNLVGALNQINCGTTTLGDFSHNLPTPEHSDAALAGLQDSGIRAVLLHGAAALGPEVAHPLSDIDRLLDAVSRGGSPVSIGMAVGGPQFSTPAIAVADLTAAAERGLVASMHQSGGAPAPAWDAVRDAGLLGPAVNIVHGAGLTEAWLQILIDAGATFTITPEIELAHGHGIPITSQLLQRGASPSLGIDTETGVTGDLLAAPAPP
jgi:5-methylthioadenosine/S-adenosylhomocysteine deaminase